MLIAVASVPIEEKEPVESPRLEDSQEDDSIIELALPWLKPVTMVRLHHRARTALAQACHHGMTPL